MNQRISVLLPIILSLFSTCLSFKFVHHDYEAMLRVMNDAHDRCPEITKVYSLSESSVEKRSLAVIEFSDNPGRHETGKIKRTAQKSLVISYFPLCKLSVFGEFRKRNLSCTWNILP